MLHHLQTHFTLVDAYSEPGNHAPGTQLLQRPQAASVRQFPETLGAFLAVCHGTNVVDVEDVNASQAQTLEARLPGAHHAVVAIVVFGYEREWRGEPIA